VADDFAAVGSVICDFSLDLASCARSIPGLAIEIVVASSEHLARVQKGD